MYLSTRTTSVIKHALARQAIKSYEDTPGAFVFSTQVLQEFYNAPTRKLAFSPTDAKVELLRLRPADALTVTPLLILAAVDLHGQASLSLWDALIIAAAQSVGCDEIWSEDLQTDRRFGKLKIVNPFL